MSSVNDSATAESLSIWLANAKKIHDAGRSLAASLYAIPVTLSLQGPLGSGKTTFLQGFAEGLGIRDSVTSPTFALEQRYRDSQGRELLHLDLYRLSTKDAALLVQSSADHIGIRCIEWADRLPMEALTEHSISLRFEEKDNGRSLLISFEDAQIPSTSQIVKWRKEAALQPHIIRHCTAVADLACALATFLIAEGRIVRTKLLRQCSELHDLFRYLDFRLGAAPAEVTVTEHEQDVWQEWRKRFSGMRHEEACAAFLQENGFAAAASVVKTHGWHLAIEQRRTTEQKLLFYADKRVAVEKRVTLRERFQDFAVRYGAETDSAERAKWYEETLAVERDLFPHGVPL